MINGRLFINEKYVIRNLTLFSHKSYHQNVRPINILMQAAPIVWAQRKDIVLVTVRVFDAVGAAVTSDSTSFTYTGKSANGDVSYNQRLELFGEIDETQTKYVNRPRGTEIVLKKKDDTVWWPRLAKTTVKLHYVSVDWNKWVDSSSDEEDKPAFNWDPSEMGDFGGPMDDDDDSDDDGMEDVSPEPAEDAGAPPPVE